LHPLWAIPSAFLFGGMLVRANALQRTLQVPTALIIALNGLIVVFVVSTEHFRRRLQHGVAVAPIEAEKPVAGTVVVESEAEG